jgi:hypothetical protein
VCGRLSDRAQIHYGRGDRAVPAVPDAAGGRTPGLAPRTVRIRAGGAGGRKHNVRCAPHSRHLPEGSAGPLSATSGNHGLSSPDLLYAITLGLLWIYLRPVWINQRQSDPVRFDRRLDRTLNLYHRVPR